MTVALLFKFIQLLRGKLSYTQSCLDSAETYLIRYAQKIRFLDEIKFW